MKTPLRVCMAVTRFPPIPGGAGQQALTLAHQLCKQGISVFFIAGRFDDSPAREDIDGVTVLRYRIFGKIPLWQIFWGFRILLPLLLRSRSFDILHIHGPNLWCLPALLMARLMGKPVVVKMTALDVDDPVGLGKQRLGWLKQRSLFWADAVVSIASALTDRCEMAGIQDAMLWKVPNSVDTEKFRPSDHQDQKALRQKLDLPEEGLLVLFVGIVTRRKGVDLLIDSWREVQKKFPNSHLVMAGATDFEPELFETVKSSLENWGIAASVRFIGHVKNVNEYMRASEVLVFPTRNEGLPNVLLEAMACGLSCVVRDIPGIIGDVVRDGENGVVVYEEDALQFAQAVDSVLDDKHNRTRLGMLARRTIEERFAVAVIGQFYERSYQKLLQKK